MLLTIKKSVSPALAFLAILAIASSAQPAIRTDCGSICSSWSAPQSVGSDSRTTNPDPVPLLQPAVEGIYSPDLNTSSTPGSMNGPNSSHSHAASGVAILTSPVQQLTNQLSTPATPRSSLAVGTWCGDQPLDPPRYSN